MKLTRTQSGNYAKQVRIGGGHTAREFFKTRGEAQANVRTGEEVVPVVLGAKLAARLYGAIEWAWVIIDDLGRKELTPMIGGLPLGAPREMLPDGGGHETEQLAAYMVGTPAKGRLAMTHASAAECAAAGFPPGPCNE